MAAQIGAPAAAIRAHEELFAYWNAVRRGGGLPTRRDIHPGGFKRLLPTVSLIEPPGRSADFRIRLAGTGLYSVYGGEITGRTLGQVYSPAAAEYWRQELGRVVSDRRPRVGAHSLAWRGASHLSSFRTMPRRPHRDSRSIRSWVVCTMMNSCRSFSRKWR